MNRFEQWKEAIKKTPPERLLKLNMQGYVLQTIGILFVSIILIIKGIWYILFAFIFSVINNYSGFISNYQQYKQLLKLKEELGLKEEEIKSPHIRKMQTIKKSFGRRAGWISLFFSCALSFFVIGPFNNQIIKILLFLVATFFFYYIFYFVLFYKLAERREKNGMAKSEKEVKKT